MGPRSRLQIFELVSNTSFGTQELRNLLAWQKENSASRGGRGAFPDKNKTTWIDWLNLPAAEKLAGIAE